MNEQESINEKETSELASKGISPRSVPDKQDMNNKDQSSTCLDMGSYIFAATNCLQTGRVWQTTILKRLVWKETADRTIRGGPSIEIESGIYIYTT